MEDQARTLSGISVAAGLWLIIAPFILHYNSSGNMWQEIIFGSIVAIFSLIHLRTPRLSWPSWMNLLIGIWVIISSWVISGTTSGARWNQVIVGIIIAILAWTSGAVTSSSHRQHHSPA